MKEGGDDANCIWLVWKGGTYKRQVTGKEGTYRERKPGRAEFHLSEVGLTQGSMEAYLQSVHGSGRDVQRPEQTGERGIM